MNRIEQIRKQRNLSRKEIYKYVGICKKTYYSYAVKDKPIPSDKLVRLSKILKCSTDYLLGIKDYTQITVMDKKGAILADISQDTIIEHKDFKAILT